jgi:hypothetical protein
MSSWTTNRAEVRTGILFLAVACGCAGTPSAGRCRVDPSPPKPTCPPAAECARVPGVAPPATTTPPHAGSNDRIVRISTFDCSKAEDFQEGAPPTDAIRISKWMAGGPGGATWNATDLLCFADVETTCAEGQLSSSLRVGQHLVADHKTAIAQPGPQHIQLTASERTWRAGLDIDKAGRGPLFRTAVFSFVTEIACTKPVEVAPGTAVFGESADSSAFVAGFANGE